MKVLFVHQSFPAQYKHIARVLAAQPGNEVVALHQGRGRDVPGVRGILYQPTPSKATGHARFEPGLSLALENANAVLEQARRLKAEGFRPDIMLGHNGWGETLFLKDVWPDVPLLSFFEFFYHAEGADTGFDPEFPPDGDVRPRLRMMNTVNLLGLHAADWGQSPTVFQAQQYPALYRSRLSVVHDGIDTDAIRPNPNRSITLPGRDAPLTVADEVVTYVSRNLEPYRGFHVFMRALPEILGRRPKAQVIVVGGDDVSYGPRLAGKQCFREALLAEQAGRIDLERVHFLGQLPYEHFLALLQISAVHVYLTYPFVLSWSMLEAMSAGCLVVGSATPPVQEVIRHGDNGLLVDFFDTKGLADRIDAVLDHPDRMAELRAAARRTVVERYDLNRVCLPIQLALVEDLVAGREPTPRGQFTIDGALAMAGAAVRRGDLAGAESIYRQVMAQRPDHRAAAEGLALILIRSGRRDEGIALLDRAARPAGAG